MEKDNEVRCVYCGAVITEIQSNNPQDYLHPEYEKYTDENPKYCCSYCNGLTSINRALYNMIHIESDSLYSNPSIVARELEEEADFLEKNADEIANYYKEVRENAATANGGTKNGEN